MRWRLFGEDGIDVEAPGLPDFGCDIHPTAPPETGSGTVGLLVTRGNIVCHLGDATPGDCGGVILIGYDKLSVYAGTIAARAGFEAKPCEKIRASVVWHSAGTLRRGRCARQCPGPLTEPG